MFCTKKFRNVIRVIALITLEAMLCNGIAYAGDLKISRFHGRVIEQHQGSNGKTIVHIKDAHCNYDAQSNICHLLNALYGQGYDFVALEGVEGTVQAPDITSFPDQEAIQDVTQYFVKKGFVSGAECFMLTGPAGSVKVFGVEDKNLYLKNYQALMRSLDVRHTAKGYCSSIDEILQKIKNSLFSGDLADVDSIYKDYLDGKISFYQFSNYLKKPIEKHDIDLWLYENYSLMLQANKLESSIDFELLSMERRQLIDKVVNMLPKEEANELLQWNLGYKLETIKPQEFHNYLLDKCKKLELSMEEYPAVQTYAEYLNIYEEINVPELFDETEEILQVIKSELYASEEQIEVDKYCKVVSVLQNFFDLKLSPKDLKYYVDHEQDFQTSKIMACIEKYANRFQFMYFIDSNVSLIDNSLPLIKDFYTLSKQRDVYLVENMVSEMELEGADNGVLITGGFHTDGMMKLLKEKGFSYYVVSPLIHESDDKKTYISMLMNEKSPFEKRIETMMDQASTLAVASRFGNPPLLDEAGAQSFKMQFKGLMVAFAVSKFAAAERELMTSREALESFTAIINNFFMQAWAEKHFPELARISISPSEGKGLDVSLVIGETPFVFASFSQKELDEIGSLFSANIQGQEIAIIDGSVYQQKIEALRQKADHIAAAILDRIQPNTQITEEQFANIIAQARQDAGFLAQYTLTESALDSISTEFLLSRMSNLGLVKYNDINSFTVTGTGRFALLVQQRAQTANYTIDIKNDLELRNLLSQDVINFLEYNGITNIDVENGVPAQLWFQLFQVVAVNGDLSQPVIADLKMYNIDVISSLGGNTLSIRLTEPPTPALAEKVRVLSQLYDQVDEAILSDASALVELPVVEAPTTARDMFSIPANPYFSVETDQRQSGRLVVQLNNQSFVGLIDVISVNFNEQDNVFEAVHNQGDRTRVYPNGAIEIIRLNGEVERYGDFEQAAQPRPPISQERIDVYNQTRAEVQDQFRSFFQQTVAPAISGLRQDVPFAYVEDAIPYEIEGRKLQDLFSLVTDTAQTGSLTQRVEALEAIKERIVGVDFSYTPQVVAIAYAMSQVNANLRVLDVPQEQAALKREMNILQFEIINAIAENIASPAETAPVVDARAAEKLAIVKDAFFGQMGALNVISFHILLSRYDIEADSLFEQYDAEFDVVVVKDEVMKIIAQVVQMDAGQAFNLKGVPVVTASTIEQARNGDKDAIFFIKHEHRHTDYHNQNGDTANFTVEQNILDELYAYFAAFLDVWGAESLGEVRNSRIGSGTWAQIVGATLVKDYLDGIYKDQLDDQAREVLRVKLTAATFILDSLFKKYGEVGAEYLKQVGQIDAILSIVERSSLDQLFAMYSTESTPPITVPDYDALRAQFIAFRDQKQAPVSPVQRGLSEARAAVASPTRAAVAQTQKFYNDTLQPALVSAINEVISSQNLPVMGNFMDVAKAFDVISAELQQRGLLPADGSIGIDLSQKELRMDGIIVYLNTPAIKLAVGKLEFTRDAQTGAVTVNAQSAEQIANAYYLPLSDYILGPIREGVESVGLDTVWSVSEFVRDARENPDLAYKMGDMRQEYLDFALAAGVELHLGDFIAGEKILDVSNELTLKQQGLFTFEDVQQNAGVDIVRLTPVAKVEGTTHYFTAVDRNGNEYTIRLFDSQIQEGSQMSELEMLRQLDGAWRSSADLAGQFILIDNAGIAVIRGALTPAQASQLDSLIAGMVGQPRAEVIQTPEVVQAPEVARPVQINMPSLTSPNLKSAELGGVPVSTGDLIDRIQKLLDEGVQHIIVNGSSLLNNASLYGIIDSLRSGSFNGRNVDVAVEVVIDRPAFDFLLGMKSDPAGFASWMKQGGAELLMKLARDEGRSTNEILALVGLIQQESLERMMERLEDPNDVFTKPFDSVYLNALESQVLQSLAQWLAENGQLIYRSPVKDQVVIKSGTSLNEKPLTAEQIAEIEYKGGTGIDALMQLQQDMRDVFRTSPPENISALLDLLGKITPADINELAAIIDAMVVQTPEVVQTSEVARPVQISMPSLTSPNLKSAELGGVPVSTGDLTDRIQKLLDEGVEHIIVNGSSLLNNASLYGIIDALRSGSFNGRNVDVAVEVVIDSRTFDFLLGMKSDPAGFASWMKQGGAELLIKLARDEGRSTNEILALVGLIQQESLERMMERLEDQNDVFTKTFDSVYLNALESQVLQGLAQWLAENGQLIYRSPV
ncbi:MAG: hypothetical protein C4541_08380, partial [Candidatus Auribacter fodinae]